MNNVDLSKLPLTVNGKIDWNNADNCIVDFEYNGVKDSFIIIKSIDCRFVLISYKEKEIKIYKDCIRSAHLGKLFNFSVAGNYRYKVGEIIDRPLSSLYICRQIRMGNRNVKGYEVICLSCLYHFKIQEANLLRGDGCSVCSNHKIIPGINDLWTVNPEIANNLMNPDDGYKYTTYSNVNLDFICPECGNIIKNRSLTDTIERGLICKKCSDGKSYPNKFMYNLLEVLNIDFDTEIKFDWCIFKKYNSDIMSYGLYDFVIENLKLIIEMDSGLGHGNNLFLSNGITKEESIYRDNIKNKLAIENGYKIIRIKCEYYGRQDKFNICKQAIINSEFSKLFDLSNVNWDEINKKSHKSLVIKVGELYKNGSTVKEISQQLKLTNSTVYDYIKINNNIKCC